jgi:hypothetical protein
MTIARMIGIGIAVMFALAIGIASFDPVYAEVPCCTLMDGTWIVTKTGKPASPEQIRTVEKSQPPQTSIKTDVAPRPTSRTRWGRSASRRSSCRWRNVNCRTRRFGT